MSLMQPLILIVDDDAELSTMLVELLAREGWATHTVLTAATASVQCCRTNRTSSCSTRCCLTAMASTSRDAGVRHIPPSAW
jgi:CheY-like chemotaxis protein